jgi:hypothetical protein
MNLTPSSGFATIATMALTPSAQTPEKLLHGNTEFSVQNFAISTHYWSSIISKDPELYIKIRTGVSFKWLTIVNEIKTWTNWTRLSGAELKLAKIKEAMEQEFHFLPIRLRDSTLWKRWDSRAEKKYPDLKPPEIRFAEVIFMDKGRELDGWSRHY